jgi:hypothetical protein
MYCRVLSVCVFATLLGMTVLAAPPEKAMSSSETLDIDDDAYIDANRIFMFVTNHGNYGRDLAAVFGYDYGTWWPYAGDITAIEQNIGGAGELSPQFAAGLWLGGTVSGQTRVAVSEYNSEYVPGPMQSGTFVPDNPLFRVYKLYSDSLEDNPNYDFTNWPVGQGAPVNEWDQPVMHGDQMLWAVFNDADPSEHDNDCGGTAPLGIEVQQTVYAIDAMGSLGDAVFVDYRLYNRGLNQIENFYISLWSDIEIGGNGDDYVGCDTMQGYFFGYNADNDDIQYGTAPPAAGYRILAGPAVSSPGDSAYFFGGWVDDLKNLEMSAFVKYISGTDPDNAAETYEYMQGLTKTGAPYEYLGDILTFMHSGDPVAGTGDLDSDPADRRMMASFGPLTFDAGDSQYVLIAFAASQGGDNVASVGTLKNVLDFLDDVMTSADEARPFDLPAAFTVSQNYPNPFNPATTIEYSLPRRAPVTVDIYNVLGQRVRRLVDEIQSAGRHRVVWNGTDENGKPVSTGLYFYKVTAGERITSRKMVLLK